MFVSPNEDSFACWSVGFGLVGIGMSVECFEYPIYSMRYFLEKELIIQGSCIHVQMDENVKPDVKPDIILGEEVDTQSACACCDFCSRAGAG